jgi:hypothetical protein
MKKHLNGKDVGSVGISSRERNFLITRLRKLVKCLVFQKVLSEDELKVVN